jgi:hypothetical protein
MGLPTRLMLTRASTMSLLVLHCNYLGVLILLGDENLRAYYQSKAHQRIVPLVSKNVINAFVVEGSSWLCRVDIPSASQHFGNLIVNSPVSVWKLNLSEQLLRSLSIQSKRPEVLDQSLP